MFAGYLSKKVQFEQTKLFMQLKGDYCSNGVDRNNVLIYFHCDLWSINNYKMNLEIVSICHLELSSIS